MYYSVEQYRALNLMIVGVNGSGKTSLMKRLNRKQTLPEDEINIDGWKFSAEKTSAHKICFITWDFPSEVCIAMY